MFYNRGWGRKFENIGKKVQVVEKSKKEFVEAFIVVEAFNSDYLNF